MDLNIWIKSQIKRINQLKLNTMNLKSIIITGLLSFFLYAAGVAGNDPVAFKEFYKKYKNEEGFTSINVPTGLLGLIMSSEDKELKELMKNIDDINFLIYSGEQTIGPELASELKSGLKSRWYKDLMMVNDSGEKIEFKIREDGKVIREVIMIMSGNDTFIVMSIEGAITQNQVKELSKSIDLEGINGFSMQ